MVTLKYVIFIMKLLFLFFLFACNSFNEIESYIHDIEPISISGNINAVIEIPSGTHDKFEVSKETGQIVQDIEDGLPRKIKYIGYPANYGMIPKTLLSPETGGDGDPLDVIVLGEQLQKGSVVEIKLIGILKMLDNGEIDDKLIAVRVNNSIFSSVTSFNELKKSYQGVIEILEIWFTNYKGSKKIAVRGFENEQKALEIFKSARQQYKNHNDKN
mgnify:FL=1